MVLSLAVSVGITRDSQITLSVSSSGSISLHKSATAPFQSSSFQRASGFEYKMPAINEIDHHFLSNSVPFTIWLVDVSFPYHFFTQTSPRYDQHPNGNLLGVCCKRSKNVATQFSSYPGVLHVMSLNMDMKMILP